MNFFFTFFQQHVFFYILLQEQTMSASCFLQQAEHIANGKIKEK